MKKMLVVGALFGLLLGAAVVAGDKARTVTLEGKVLCAKCALQEEGRNKCQNVLVVEEQGKARHYYMAENDTSTTFGEVCMSSPVVRVTGTLEEKDGQTWIEATAIERLQDKG